MNQMAAIIDRGVDGWADPLSLARDVHTYFMENIRRGNPDIPIWRTLEIYEHLHHTQDWRMHVYLRLNQEKLEQRALDLFSFQIIEEPDGTRHAEPPGKDITAARTAVAARIRQLYATKAENTTFFRPGMAITEDMMTRMFTPFKPFRVRGGNNPRIKQR